MSSIKISIVLVILATYSKIAASQAIEGAFSCEVDRVFLIAMEDGSTQLYNGYEGGLATGDKIFFNYVYNSFGTSTVKDFSMRTPRGAEPIFNTTANIQKRDSNTKETFPNTFFGSNKYDGGRTVLTVSEDSIYAEGVPGGELELTRYFKNDWHGFLTDNGIVDRIKILGLNCRHVRDGFEPMVRNLKASGF